MQLQLVQWRLDFVTSIPKVKFSEAIRGGNHWWVSGRLAVLILLVTVLMTTGNVAYLGTVANT